MRIFIDTNIIISALLFPHSNVAKVLLYVAANHNIILCEQNIKELYEVIGRLDRKKLVTLNTLLSEMAYELIPDGKHTRNLIRDIKDQPILNAASAADVEIILTGDKDFLSLDIKKPKCMSVNEFSAKYM
jgi:putative PIN family toxin of toxin-antitoxin system